MRILFVSMADSIHTARWIEQIIDQGWDVHLFPSLDSAVHPQLRVVTVHDYMIRTPETKGRDLMMPGTLAWHLPCGAGFADRLLKRLRRSKALARWTPQRAVRLAQVIRDIRPDIVHSQEFQRGGYLTLAAKEYMDGFFPKWIVTNWGSDIFYFGHIPEHAPRIRSVLEQCDFYSCECHRDVELGRQFGFTGEILPVFPNTGGFDLEKVKSLRHPGRISERRLIMLKGYQGWVYRALEGLQALASCAKELDGYRIAVYLASPEVVEEAKRLSESKRMAIDIIPYSPHEDILRLHGKARISIGLSISDAISTSFLEAIVMGSFPVQSCTSCADEWVNHGKTGLIVPPDDVPAVTDAIKWALTDDELVDKAAEQNAKMVTERLDSKKIQQQVVQMYEKVVSQSK
jgi:glycosyltransferase involved in cell wall biosynthesis